MITHITKKEMKRVKSLRKNSAAYMAGRLYFTGADNKAYYCDQSGMAGVKEMNDYNKKLKETLTAQGSLLDL